MRTYTPEGAGARFAAALARRLWVALALALVVGAGALYLFARPSASWRHAYVATQAVRIVASAGSAASSYDVYLADEEAGGLARAMASGAVFSSAAFDGAVASALQARHGALVSRFGADVPDRISTSDIAAAFSATNSGDVVTVTCRWSSAAGANALLSTAVGVLTGSDDLRALFSPNAAIQTPDGAQAAPEGTFTAAHLDSSAMDAAWNELLARIALGALFGLAVAILLAGVSLRATTAHRTEIAATSSAYDA